MPEAASTRPHSPLSLNSDGERHPLENSLAVFTLISGLIVFAAGWVVELRALASVLGIVSMLVGLYAQTADHSGNLFVDGLTRHQLGHAARDVVLQRDSVDAAHHDNQE